MALDQKLKEHTCEPDFRPEKCKLNEGIGRLNGATSCFPPTHRIFRRLLKVLFFAFFPPWLSSEGIC